MEGEPQYTGIPVYRVALIRYRDPSRYRKSFKDQKLRYLRQGSQKAIKGRGREYPSWGLASLRFGQEL